MPRLYAGILRRVFRGCRREQVGDLLPDGAGGEAFLVYANFAAIRRYNSSDLYALAVGLLGDMVVG